MTIENPTQKITLTHKTTGLKVFITLDTTIAKWQDNKWLSDKKPTQTSLFNY